jgi:protein-L-isoaspartate(D-aspartate) O-methyltransferase
MIIDVDFEASRRDMVARIDRDIRLSPEVAQALLSVPREQFVPEAHRDEAYVDAALPLGFGATISQPSMLAIMLMELRLEPGMGVLEVGSGCGYFLALLHATGACAVGIEIVPHLAEASKATLASLDITAEVITGDAAEVHPEGLFDRIVFSAASDTVPEWAVELLAQDGFVLAPVGPDDQQELVRRYRDREERTGRFCRFVRLA